MDNQLYREIILEHWKNPQNFGAVFNPDIEITDFNPLCGDKIRITAKMEGNKIADIKFEGEGCAISIAAGSILTEEVKNKDINEVENLSQQEFLNNLEIQLTTARLKCALLSYSALKKALKKT